MITFVQCKIVILKFEPPLRKHVMYCYCAGSLKSLGFFSSQDLRMLDKTSLGFIGTYVLWCLVLAKTLCSRKE